MASGILSQMKILKCSDANRAKVIAESIACLSKGGLIVYPTETCYGAGVDAANRTATLKLLSFKGQRGSKPIALAVSDRTMASHYVSINATADHLYRTFLPGPLTVVSRSLATLSPSLESGTGTLGIRIPAHPLALAIIKRLGRPLTATSANTSGKKPPYSVKDFEQYTSQKRLALVDLFLDAGTLPPNPPSTVVDTTLNEPAVLRQGEIVIPKHKGTTVVSGSQEETQRLAGRLFSTYRKELSHKPLIFALQGELGAGKTQFVKWLAKALGIRTNIPSPTFVLIKEYPYSCFGISGTLYHVDTWRLEKGDEVMDLGLGAMLRPGNVIAIEWLQKVKSLLRSFSDKAVIIWISFAHVSESEREIRYQA